MIFKNILLILMLTISYSQIQYSGYINTELQIKNNTAKPLDVPYRVSEFNFSYTFALLDIISKTDIEIRNKNINPLLSLRELYIGLYPSFGEIRFGKQINSWGFVDGNNPTDNLNPYDLNYMFLSGVDRKIGTISFTFDTYINDYKLGLVIIPKHEPNREPIKGTDFQINDNEVPNSSNNDQSQWGLSLEAMLGESDIMLTYFNGYDFSPSYSGSNDYLNHSLAPNNIILTDHKFEYRNTQVFGLSTVSFWNNLIIRTELALFDTKNSLKQKFSANYTANYIQYVFQLEYPSSEITFNSQIIGNKFISAEGTIMNSDNILNEVNSDNFNMGLGTPFANFTDNALIISAQKTLVDWNIDIAFSGMINLSDRGYMLGSKLEYSPLDNWMILVDSKKFIGNNNHSSPNIFNILEEFSNTRLAVKYSF